METGPIKTDMKVVSRELVQEGYTKRFDIRYYWDSHGKTIWDFQEPETWKYPEPKKYKLYKEVREYYFEFCPTMTCEFLFLYIDDIYMQHIDKLYFLPYYFFENLYRRFERLPQTF